MSESIQKKLNILVTALVVLSALICVLLMGRIVQGKDAALFGFRFCSVLTGSMEPTIPVGATVVIREVDPNTLQEGDVITFVSRESSIYGNYNTHRIISVEQDAAGERCFITRGDANNAQDALPVQAADVQGKMVFCVRTDVFSNIWKFLCTKAGFFTVIVLPMMVLTGYFMRDFRRQVQLLAQANAEAEAEKERDKTEE